MSKDRCEKVTGSRSPGDSRNARWRSDGDHPQYQYREPFWKLPPEDVPVTDAHAENSPDPTVLDAPRTGA